MARLSFPDDLLRAQRDWNRTYEALAVPRPQGATALRRRLLRLSTLLAGHPVWGAGPPRAALRRQVRAAEREGGG